MGSTITRSFSSRQDADLAVERLVQEHGFERTDIFVTPDGKENSVGNVHSGGDAAGAREVQRTDAPLGDPIKVSVDVNDDARAAVVEATFDELIQ